MPDLSSPEKDHNQAIDQKASSIPDSQNGNSVDIEPKDFKIRVNVAQSLLIGLGFMSAMIAWSYYNFKIPIILNGIQGEVAGTWARIGILGTDPAMEILGGFLMTLDNIIAIILQPYFGRLSDRLESKYGRRSPFMIIGLPLAVLSLFILPFFSELFIFIAVICSFNLAMAFYRPAIMSLMPDKTPPQVRSSANSFVSLMGGFGTIFGMLIPAIVSKIPGTAPLETGVYETQDFFWQDFWGFILTGALMLACLIIFIRTIKETPTGDNFFKIAKEPVLFDVYTQKVAQPFVENIESQSEKEKEKKKKSGFFDDWREILKEKDRSAFWILFTVFAYLFGFNALEFSFGRYATSYLQISEGMAGVLLAIMPVMLIVFAIPAGRWAEKYGRLTIMKVGLLVTSIVVICIIITMPFIRNIALMRNLTFIDLLPLAVLLSIGGIGYGLTHINALPVVWQLAPKNKIGSYTGIYYMISSLGAILSPPAISTVYTIVIISGGIQWVALFPYYLIGLIVGFWFVMKVKRGDAEPLSKEDLNKLHQLYSESD
jgi:maltose/moltooligosaccharide transporter